MTDFNDSDEFTEAENRDQYSYAGVYCHECGQEVCQACGCCCNSSCENCSCPDVERE